MARPEKYDEGYCKTVQVACKLGATDADIADMLGVSIRTINYWRAKKPEFASALKVGKEVADERVERSLFARATGYEHDDVDIRVIGGDLVQTPIKKHYPPDSTAAIFWLKNRKPKEWRDKVEQQLTGADGGPIQARIAIEHVKPPPRAEDSDD